MSRKRRIVSDPVLFAAYMCGSMSHARMIWMQRARLSWGEERASNVHLARSFHRRMLGYLRKCGRGDVTDLSEPI